MKWNEVRNRFQESINTVSQIPDKVREQKETLASPQAQSRNRTIIAGGIFLVVIVACIVLYFFVSFSKKESPVINQEQAVFIQDFFTENPPEPVNADQGAAIQDLLDSDFSGFDTAE